MTVEGDCTGIIARRRICPTREFSNRLSSTSCCAEEEQVAYALVALIALGLALIVPYVSPDAPPAEPERAAVRRSGVLGGASYHIEVPANWRGGLVVFAHGIQRGPGPGAVTAPPVGGHIVGEGHAWIASG